MRLDKRLKAEHPELSWRQIREAIEKGQVTVDGRVQRDPGLDVSGDVRRRSESQPPGAVARPRVLRHPSRRRRDHRPQQARRPAVDSLESRSRQLRRHRAPPRARVHGSSSSDTSPTSACCIASIATRRDRSPSRCRRTRTPPAASCSRSIASSATTSRSCRAFPIRRRARSTRASRPAIATAGASWSTTTSRDSTRPPTTRSASD